MQRNRTLDGTPIRDTLLHENERAPQNMKFDSIQYVRAFAALLVVLYHESVYLQRLRGFSWLHDVLGGRPGVYGVIAFFVVSGYLMATIAPKYRPETFIAHRIIRIYPAYWFCVALAAVYFIGLWYVTRPNADYVPSITGMLLREGNPAQLLRLTLVPMVFPDYPLGIEWTLLYETTFYIIIFLVSLAGMLKFLPYLASVWLVLLIYLSIATPTSQAGWTQPTLITVPLFGLNAAFILGILGTLLIHFRLKPIWTIFGGLVIVVLEALFPTNWSTLQISLGIFCIVIGLVALEKNGRLFRSSILVKAGGWSYAMYLLHVPVLVGTFKLMGQASPILMFAAGLIMTIIVSAAIGTIDVAGYYYLKRWLDRYPKFHRPVAVIFVAIFFAAGVLGLYKSG